MNLIGVAVESLNFSWLIDGEVAGCAAPMSVAELKFLRDQGVAALVRMAHPEKDDFVLSSRDVRAEGLEDLHLPVPDFHAPKQGQIQQAVDFISAKVAEGKPVVVSCGAGCGRTGTILACYLVAKGSTPEDALRMVLDKRPCSREIVETTPQQKEAIFAFARRHAA